MDWTIIFKLYRYYLLLQKQLKEGKFKEYRAEKFNA